MNRKIIEPKTLPGFRDFLPESMMPREWLMDVARKTFRSWGFAPIDTPALEFLEILTGKGSEETDRQMYHFVDNGGRSVGMRFDLTVPLARFVAQHFSKLGMPFKRYHLGTVWRGERQQAGRYREFIQADFDTIGTTSILSDAETALVIHDLIRALGIERFVIRINNRKLLNGMLDHFGLRDMSTQVLRAVDKLDKAGGTGPVAEELRNAGIADNQISSIVEMVSLKGPNSWVLEQLERLAGDNELARQGLAELRELDLLTTASGANPVNFRIDPSIARGLDYYTGSVFETILEDLPNIGSVCSGGRYDNLAGLYTKQQLPGIGASLGLDRMLTALETLGTLPASRTPADVLIVNFGQEHFGRYLAIASDIRAAGYPVEVYPDSRKLAQQFKYADQRGHKACVIAGGDELEKGLVRIKWMASGQQDDVPVNGVARAIADALAAGH